MIAEKQLKKAFKQVVEKLLKRGTVPTQTEILNELKVVVPTPGKPTAKVSLQKNFTQVDTSAYNSFWNKVSADLTILYEQLYDHIALTSANFDRVVSWSSGINAASLQLQTFLDNLAADDRSLDNVSISFGESEFIDFGSDVYGPKTTTTSDYRNGITTLPLNNQSFSSIPLHKATISGKPNTGKEQPVIGNKITNLINDSTNIPWMTQVIDSGGGTSYTILLSFPYPVSISSCSVDTTHNQQVDISYMLTDGTWTRSVSQLVNESIQTNILAARITLTREIGISKGSDFVYTFGVSSINLRSQEYIQNAQFTSSPIAIDTSGRRASKIEFSTEESTPEGTSIDYSVSLYKNETELLLTTENVPVAENKKITTKEPLYLGSSNKNIVTVRELTNTDLSVISNTTSNSFYEPGINLYLKTLLDPNSQNVTVDYNLLADGNGVFIGEAQWKVDYYEVDWSKLANHVPDPTDWKNLKENGFNDDEVISCYSDLNRSTDSVIVTDDTDNIIHSCNLTNVSDFKYDYLTCDVVAGQTTITVNVYCPSNPPTLLCTGSMLIADVKANKGNNIDLYESADSGISGYITINNVPTTINAKLIVLNNRLDIIRGPITGAGFSDKTTYRYSTNFYSEKSYSITVPGSSVRQIDTRFLSLYNGITDLAAIPAHQYDGDGANSDLFATTYLNDKRLVRTQSGLTYNITKGWNSLVVYLYCAIARFAPISLGISLSPKSYILSDNTVIRPISDFDLDYPCLDVNTNYNNEVIPHTSITRTISKKERLQACSKFDLLWNTPILYKDRYCAELLSDGNDGYKTDIYLPYTDTGRYTVYYDSVDPNANTDDIAYMVIKANLSTSYETKTTRPYIHKITSKLV